MTTQLTTTSPAAEPQRPSRGRLKRLVLGRPSDPRWARPALWAVLALAAVLYSWDLSRNGDANTFYAAAVLSGTESWKAFFYGSLDSASFITVDKPPFAFWIMGISARVFGFNSWSLLLPQAAEGVAAVAVVYAAVRRSIAGLTGERGAHAAALIAALALTLTPMVVAIDRDDNPDTMLTLLLALGAWALLESLRAGRTGKRPLLWLILSAVAFGLAFNTKMLEGFVALPVLPVVYLIAADARLRTRIGRLSIAGGVLAVITLSWMTIVDLIPKSSRPYVGSSANDTVWNLAVGYNGFGRITGNERGGFGVARTGATGTGTGTGTGIGTGTGTGAGTAGTARAEPSAGPAGPATSASSPTGPEGSAASAGRPAFGGYSPRRSAARSPAVPFAALALIGTLILIGRRPRTDLARASVLLWGGWLLLEFFVLSFQQGIQHSYYTSAMAPPIAALTGIGAVAFYQAYRRRSGWLSLVLPLAIAVTGAWSFVLLRRTPSWNPWLAWTVLGATVVAVLALAFGWLRARRVAEDVRSAEGLDEQQSPARTDGSGRRFAAGRRSRLFALAGVAGLIAVLAGPAAYAVTPLSARSRGPTRWLARPLAAPSGAWESPRTPSGTSPASAAARAPATPAAARLAASPGPATGTQAPGRRAAMAGTLA